MDSIADLTSAPIRLRVDVKGDDGKPTGEALEYDVHPLTLADVGVLQRWVDGQFPDPFEQAWEAIERQKAKNKPFNVAQEQFIIRTAQELAMRPRHLIGTPEADTLLLSTDGFRQIIVEGIRKGDPSFDEGKADALMKHMTQLDLVRALASTQMNLMVSDPKVMPPDETAKSRTTGGGGSRRARRAAKAHRDGGKSSTG